MGVLQNLESLIIPAEKLNADGIPSASLAVLEDGKITSHVITTGREDTETVYQAASITKAITALAVAKLVDDGRVSYDTKVEHHLPSEILDHLIDPETAHLLKYVTVGMLLSHTSGLSQHGFPGYPGKPPSASAVLSGDRTSNTPRVHFISFPGAQFSYSGGGYTVLQIALENIMEKPFLDIMREVVLEPLNMKRSWYGDLPSTETNFAKAHFTGYYQAEPSYNRFAELAAAGLWTTPTDLLKAISAVQGSISTDSGFLTRETAKTMLTKVEEAGDGYTSVAQGWFINDHIFGHSGDNIPGYNTTFFGFHSGLAGPSTSNVDSTPRNGLAIMTNSQLGHDNAIKEISSAIFYLKGWERHKGHTPFFSKDDFVPYAAPSNAKADESWKQWIGTWENDWQILDQNGPTSIFKSFLPMKLKPAAIPNAHLMNDKQELNFVVSGLKTGLRLTWKDDERVFDLIQEEVKTLKRVE